MSLFPSSKIPIELLLSLRESTTGETASVHKPAAQPYVDHQKITPSVPDDFVRFFRQLVTMMNAYVSLPSTMKAERLVTSMAQEGAHPSFSEDIGPAIIRQMLLAYREYASHDGSYIDSVDPRPRHLCALWDIARMAWFRADSIIGTIVVLSGPVFLMKHLL